MGRKKKIQYEYRLRWNEVVYEPGELKAISYKDGKVWATSIVKTTDVAAKLQLTAYKTALKADGSDLVFVTVAVTDKDGNTIPTAKDTIQCSLEGAVFNGLLLVILKARPNAKDPMKLVVKANDLEKAELKIDVK
ncbi:DUF4982 domain-containing protein [Solitalea koreensis]|uniref:Uncharacterized protein n=1 Tax=Solitalea koreensis TaxID=543615 RepID=A0A521DYU3_9SPHI|nr:DUF4982 domain-containing protein [Solitalea koreensis]SMO76788.1 protein of unknown function [Solitalea koreensis]